MADVCECLQWTWSKGLSERRLKVGVSKPVVQKQWTRDCREAGCPLAAPKLRSHTPVNPSDFCRQVAPPWQGEAARPTQVFL